MHVLILFDSVGGHTAAMARNVAQGVDSEPGCVARLRRVPRVSAVTDAPAPQVPDSGAPYVELSDLDDIGALILGSPTHFGNMSASLKHFLDQTTAHWLGGKLAGRPAGAFVSTGSLHGGQEATILSMLLPLLHHGMLLTGLPYTDPGLMQTRSGGTPYGASHLAGEHDERALDDTEARLCRLLGKRIAGFGRQLAESREPA